MEKYNYIFVIIFVVMIPIALYLILKPMYKHNKLSNGIVNYDTFMRKYVFSVALDKEEFYSQLKILAFLIRFFRSSLNTILMLVIYLSSTSSVIS